MRTLLHVSDVHFGPPHLPELSAAVLELVERRRPSAVVVSGDLTQRARPEQFRAARAFVDRLPVPTIVVPGNHDVPMYRFWERVFSPFSAYRRHFSPELEPMLRDEEMILVGLNTAYNWTWKDGRLTLRRLREVAELLAAVPDTVAKIVVAHHHLIPPPSFGSQRVLVNAFEAISTFSDVGVDLVLSGHLHQTYIGSSEEFYPRGERPVVILHSGTTTSNRGRGWEREKNTCNWIAIDEQAIEISHCVWEPPLGGFVEHSRHRYARHRSPGAAAVGPTL